MLAAAKELERRAESAKLEADRLTRELEAAQQRGELRAMIAKGARLAVLYREVLACRKQSEKLRRQLPA